RLRGLVGDSASAAMGTLRYSWLLTAFCVLGMIFSPLMCLYGYVFVDSAHTSGVKTRRASVGVLCGCRECRWLGGNAPEDDGSGFLDGFQAPRAKGGGSAPKAGDSSGRG